MARLTEKSAARLLRRAARRRTDGSRGTRAQRAWERLVPACATGDLADQDAVRAAESPDTDVLEMLAVGPPEPADRAAYLTLIGQREQRQAMDRDGAQLALAYWAATGEARERLRAVMAAEGDVDAVRVVVCGEQRDRAAGMSYEEVDHLGRRPWGDMFVTVNSMTADDDLKVLSPHLPEARELLERPLLHHAPRDREHVRELLPLIGDPEVRDSLDALETCLGNRFGGDIALGGTGPVSAETAFDIALDTERRE